MLKLTPPKLKFQEVALFGRAKPRGATNTWVTPHDVAW
jgi:hypothetical protein